MPRKSKEAKLLLGFFGSGEVSEKEIAATLDDYIGVQDAVVEFIVPVTKDHFSKTLEYVLDYATEKKIKYRVVTDEASAKVRSLSGYIDDATDRITVARVVNKLVAEIASYSDGDRKLIIAWDEAPEAQDDLDNISSRAQDSSIECLDLTQSLEVIDFEDDGDKGKDDKPSKAAKDDDEEKKMGKTDDGEEEPWEPYTKADLEEIAEKKNGVETLREIITEDFNGEEPPPRTRATTLIKTILELQEAEAAAGDDEDEKPRKASKSSDDDGDDEGAEIDGDLIAQVALKAAEEGVEAMGAVVVEALDAHLEALKSLITGAVEAIVEAVERSANTQVSAGAKADSSASKEEDEEVAAKPAAAGRRRRR